MEVVAGRSAKRDKGSREVLPLGKARECWA